MNEIEIYFKVRDEWNKDLGFGNYFTRIKQIPLGYNSFKGKSNLRVITIPENLSYDNIIICGSPSSGKTNIGKLIYSWKSRFYNRPTAIADPTGHEHRMSAIPNQKPRGLLTEFNDEEIQKPFGLTNLIPLSPIFVREDIMKGDKVFSVIPKDLDIKSWFSLGVTGRSIDILFDLFEKYPLIGEDAEKLYDHIKQIPTTLKQTEERMKKDEIFLHVRAVDSLIQNLRTLMGDMFFGSKDRLSPKEIIKLLKTNVLCFNYFYEKGYAKPYDGYIRDVIYKAIASGDLPPIVYVADEADLLYSAYDVKVESSSTYQGIKYVRRGRIHGVCSIFITQRLSSLHEDISGFFTYLIVGGRLTLSDLQRLKRITTPEIVEEVKKLKFDPEHNVRELMLIRNDRTWDTFYPSNCPCGTYKEKRFAL